MATAEDIGLLDRRLARQIEAFWLDRGFEVACHQVTDASGVKNQACVPGVRSDMVNGLPKPGARIAATKAISNVQ